MATGTIILPVIAAIGDATDPPALAFTAANRPYLLFDGTTDELCLWAFELPGDYASDPVIRVHYSMATATSGNIAIRTEVQAIADGEDIDTDAWSTVEASADKAVPGTAGLSDIVTDALGTPTLAPNDYIALRLGRENAAGTNAAGDMEVWAVSLTYTTS